MAGAQSLTGHKNGLVVNILPTSRAISPTLGSARAKPTNAKVQGFSISASRIARDKCGGITRLSAGVACSAHSQSEIRSQ